LPALFTSTTRSLAVDSARLSFAVWAIALVALAGWLAWFVFGSVTLVETTRKARFEVQQAPHALAVVKAGRVAATHLAIGSTVRAGEVLVEFDDSAERLRLGEEEARLASFAPRLAAVKTEIDALRGAQAADQRAAEAAVQAARARAREAEAAVVFARDHERRLIDEAQAGGVARVEALRAQAETRKLVAALDAVQVDARRIELDAQTRVRQVEAQVEALRRGGVTLEGERATSEAVVARLRADIDRLRLRAPVDGRIGEIQVVKPGTYVAEGQKLASVIPSGDLMVIAELQPSSALGRVHAGQEARVRLDGFPWTQYGAPRARVTRVAGEVRDATLRAELAVLPGQTLGVVIEHGMPGSVEIVLERVSPAMLLLRGAGHWLGGLGGAR
jgi:membrane fusion protein (multidrug efflux system)